MSRKRCCCTTTEQGAYPCQPCPAPISPATTPEWIVQIAVDATIGDSAGQGVVNGSDIWQSCLGGDCGRKVYSRRGGANTTMMASDCFGRVCDSIVDSAAPTNAGDHTIRWTFCASVFPLESPGNPYLPDVLNDQEGAVTIESVLPNVTWNFSTCTYGGDGGSDCCTVIKVYFTYGDTFPYPRIDSGVDGCFSTTAYAGTFQTWTCYYVRRVAPGQYFAEGAYSLLRCEYPAARNTIGPTATSGPCIVNGGTVCSSQHGVSAFPPTTWKPPTNINLVRLS